MLTSCTEISFKVIRQAEIEIQGPFWSALRKNEAEIRDLAKHGVRSIFELIDGLKKGRSEGAPSWTIFM